MKVVSWISVGLLLGSTSPAQAAAPVGPSPEGWKVDVGMGMILAPAFVGARDYNVSVLPNVRVAYKDKFFASVPEGIGYNVLNSHRWRVGPVAKYAFERKEDGGASPFRITGSHSDALRGLGNVAGTLELGGFAKYSWRKWRAKVEARKGVNGHDGFVANLNVTYSANVSSVLYDSGPPIIVSLGPRATFADSRYNNAYFGITEAQSRRSGLSQYHAAGGLLSYGVALNAVLPISDRITGTLFAGFDRLAPEVANSPLVATRGSRNQGSIGLFISYSFGR